MMRPTSIHNEDRITERLQGRLGRSIRLERLPGDASDRAFFRVEQGPGRPAAILMTQEPFEAASSPFCQMQRFLSGIGIPVPEVEALFPEEGWILMTDVGRSTLQEYLRDHGESTMRLAYEKALELLLTLQDRGTRGLPPESAASRTRLDREKLSAELRFTWVHLYQTLHGKDLPLEEEQLLGEWSTEIASRLDRMERVLCHRDFHSRNLLWDGTRLALVDFQDARIGPAAYDLASLLQDPYIDLADDLREELTWKFLEGRGFGRKREAEFRDHLDLAVVQRCLKAVGTYAYQVAVRNRPDYRRFIPPAMRNALRALRRFSEYDPVRRLLERDHGGRFPT